MTAAIRCERLKTKITEFCRHFADRIELSMDFVDVYRDGVGLCSVLCRVLYRDYVG